MLRFQIEMIYQEVTDKIKSFTTNKIERSFLVIKSLQHPARIYDKEYAIRIGKTIRDVVKQM